MLKHILPATALLFAGCLSAADHKIHTWKKLRLTPHFWSEGGHFSDFNKDGKTDVVVGPYWYAGPDFKKRHTIYPDNASFEITKDGKKVRIPGFQGELSGKNGYSNNFLTYTYDFNNDGWRDVLVFGWPGQDSTWYENPKNKSGLWKANVIFKKTDGESPRIEDMNGDGKPELIAFSEGKLGYIQGDWSNPAKPWTFVPISPKGKWHRFTHGYGMGDVNGDKRPDILEAPGWWEQPAKVDGTPWKFHKAPFGAGGAQMYTYDVDGDGDNDVITSLAAHGYGLAWIEQTAPGKWKQNTIINSKPEDSPFGVKFSQLHAIDLADIDGDGLLDIVTGKRFWAHGPKGDQEPGAPAVLYWFELTRKGGKAEYIPHRIDDNSGVGTQVAAGDVNGDGLLDIVVGNKKGAFVHLHSVKNVSKKKWQSAQPKRIH